MISHYSKLSSTDYSKYLQCDTVHLNWNSILKFQDIYSFLPIIMNEKFYVVSKYVLD